jgi:hypothetical protein
LDVDTKSVRVRNFHSKTVEYALDIIASMGLQGPHQVDPSMIVKRPTSNSSQTLAQLFPVPVKGSLIHGEGPEWLQNIW